VESVVQVGVAQVVHQATTLEQREPQIPVEVAVQVQRALQQVEQVALALSFSLTQYRPHRLVLHLLLAQLKLVPF
jgi:hypothetical protein